MTNYVRYMLYAIVTAASALLLAGSASAMILVNIPNVNGDSRIPGYNGWLVADSFSFGVEREMKESASKGGTTDINIGVGTLQDCTISKSLDAASAALAQFAITGNSLGLVQIAFLTTTDSRDGRPREYLRYTLDRAFVKSWSTSGDADDRPTEELAFYYNKIAFVFTSSDATGKAAGGTSMGWDMVTQKPWKP